MNSKVLKSCRRSEVEKYLRAGVLREGAWRGAELEWKLGRWARLLEEWGGNVGEGRVPGTASWECTRVFKA